MPEVFRTRDCVVLVKGDTFTVDTSEGMAVAGWRGGQGLQWAPNPRDGFRVELCDGLGCGFALWGSDESSDQFTTLTRQQPFYRYVVLGFGGWTILTSTFERYTWASRDAGGPLVPLVYAPEDPLMFSLRGYWTKEDEWTASNDPRGANRYTAGIVVQKPSQYTENYLTVQVLL